MKTKILFLGLVLSLLTVSCNKDKNDDGTMTADEVAINSKIDAENDDVSNVVEDEFVSSMANPTTGRVAASAFLPACATVSRTFSPPLTAGTTIADGTTITKTISFAQGCTMPNGNSVSGSIIMSFVYHNPAQASNTITVTFSNFQHNNFLITGTKILTRTMTAATAASPAHPIVTVNLNITATNTLTGNAHVRTGTRVREFVDGFYTPTIWDNVFKVTGSWTTSHPNGNVQTANITTPVMVKFSCANVTTTPRPSVMSEGIIAYTRGSHNATLDFGNGACDNSAVFTLDGVAHTITIN